MHQLSLWEMGVEVLWHWKAVLTGLTLPEQQNFPVLLDEICKPELSN